MGAGCVDNTSFESDEMIQMAQRNILSRNIKYPKLIKAVIQKKSFIVDVDIAFIFFSFVCLIFSLISLQIFSVFSLQIFHFVLSSFSFLQLFSLSPILWLHVPLLCHATIRLVDEHHA